MRRELSGPTKVGTKKVNVKLYLERVMKDERIMLHQNEYPVSLDAPLKRVCGCLLDVVPCESSPDSDLMEESRNKDIENVLSILKPKQHYVICNHLGIGCEEQSIEAIARFLNVTLKKVTLLEEKAFFRLRASKGAKILLQSYLG